MNVVHRFYGVLPWRFRNRLDYWLESYMRQKNHKLYKLVKFGHSNINTPEYWDKEWQSDSVQRNYEELFSRILAHIPEDARVLDVGCGIGRLSRLMREKRKAVVTGLDFSPWACEKLRADGFDAIVSSLPAIPFPDAHFDVAVATEVLEHLDEPEKTLREMARVIRPGGIIMISVPNDTLHPFEELEHQQSFTRDKVAKMLSRIGSVVEISTGKLLNGADVEFLFGCVALGGTDKMDYQ